LNKQNGSLRPLTVARMKRWRELAVAIAEKHPDWGDLQIARNIQRSAAGKRKGGVLPYSISAILKDIRYR
jgi:hypothetical protein